MAATASSTERRQHSFRTVRAPKPPLSNPAPSQVVPQASGPLYATASRMHHARSNELEWLWSCRLLLPLGSITCAADAHARRIQSRAESKSIEPRPFASFSAGAWPLGHSCKNATACETPGFAGLATKHGGEAAPTSLKGSMIRDYDFYLEASATSTTCSTETGTIPAVFIASSSAALGDMSINS